MKFGYVLPISALIIALCLSQGAFALSFGQIQPSAGDQGDWIIEPLAEQHNQEYFTAMQNSQVMLFETLGWGWPTAKMSVEGNLDTMRFHVEQHQSNAAFSYIVRDSENRQLRGAVFIHPPQQRSGVVGYRVADYSAEVTFWLNEAGQNSARGDQFVPQLLQWLRQEWELELVLLPVAGQNVFSRYQLDAAGLSSLSRVHDESEWLYRFNAGDY